MSVCRRKLILVDWGRYPIYRDKSFSMSSSACGIGNFLGSLGKFGIAADVDLCIVINSPHDQPREVYEKLLDDVGLDGRIYFRDNHARDIGAYDFGYRMARAERFSGDIVFVNGSVEGPFSRGWLDKYRELFYSKNGIGLVGATLNMFPEPDNFNGVSREHVQSWLLYSNMDILGNVFGESLIDAGDSFSNKQEMIFNGEIKISQRVLESGYGIACMAVPDYVYFLGKKWPYPFKLGWRMNDVRLRKFINNTIV